MSPSARRAGRGNRLRLDMQLTPSFVGPSTAVSKIAVAQRLDANRLGTMPWLLSSKGSSTRKRTDKI